MFADYHVHLDRLDWSVDTIEKISSNAKISGVDRVGLVVHTKALRGFEPLYSNILCDGSKHKKLKFDKDIDEYVDLVLKSRQAGYPVRLGVEVCYSSEGEDFLHKKLKEYPFDYRIGSVHMIKGMHYKTAVEKCRSIEDVGKEYYNLVLSAIESKLFNIIGHIEIVRREDIPGLEHYPDLLEKISSSLVRNNCAIEINTKWLIKHDSIVPEIYTLKFMRDKGVKLVFGSDAHHIDRIGFAKYEALKAICDAGYDGFECGM